MTGAEVEHIMFHVRARSTNGQVHHLTVSAGASSQAEAEKAVTGLGYEVLQPDPVSISTDSSVTPVPEGEDK
jgi:hypothetical protein